MSKAYVQLNNNMLSDIVPMDTNSDTITVYRKNQVFRYIVYAIILGIMIALAVYIWNSNSESFSPDVPSNRDSFPARIDSNKAISKSGRCNMPFKSKRSIMKDNISRRLGAVDKNPYTNVEREKKKRRVRWRDPLVMVMNA